MSYVNLARRGARFNENMRPSKSINGYPGLSAQQARACEIIRCLGYEISVLIDEMQLFEPTHV
jgi:hypothetical protein